MTKTSCKKLFVVTAVITLWTAITPVLSAQTSGVGCDGYTRFMWRATNNELSLWRLDPNLLNPISHAYGPYDGWEPIALTVLCNDYTYVLWRYTSGEIVVWLVDPNLNLVTSSAYGPYTGWIAESLSPDQNFPGNFLVLWRETQGDISIWKLNNNLGCIYCGSRIYGPYFGWDPTSHANARPAGSAPSSDPGTEIMKRAGNPMPQNP